jgi:hypothetical protein
VKYTDVKPEEMMKLYSKSDRFGLYAASTVFLLLGTGILPLFGIDIAVMPVSYYARQDSIYLKEESPWDITGDIIEYLEKYYDIYRDRTELNDRLAGVTDADARRVAEIYHVNYVLYGLVKEDSGSLVAEFKIYNARLEKYELFYAGDARGRYERLINSLCEHILEWYHTERDKLDVLKYELEGLKGQIRDLQSELESKEAAEEPVPPVAVEVEHEFGLKIPVRTGYWSFIEGRWVELVQGTIEASFGAEIFPRLQFPPLFDMRNELSLGMQFGYRYGMAAKRQEVGIHDIVINPYAAYHLNFYSKNWAAIGLGMFFEWGIWKIKPDDYSPVENYSQSYTGVSLLADYSYRFNKYITINLGANLYLYFVSDTSPVISPYIGTVITIVGGEYEK